MTASGPDRQTFLYYLRDLAESERSQILLKLRKVVGGRFPSLRAVELLNSMWR